MHKGGALELGRKIRETVERITLSTSGVEFHVTVSVGAATREARDGNLFDVQRRADEALYEAKDAGRNRVVFK